MPAWKVPVPGPVGWALVSLHLQKLYLKSSLALLLPWGYTSHLYSNKELWPFVISMLKSECMSQFNGFVFFCQSSFDLASYCYLLFENF